MSFSKVESLAGGYSNVRANFVTAQPLSGGYSTIRLAFLLCEALISVEGDRPVSTNPFPGFGNSVSDPSVPAAANPATSGLPGLAFSVHKRPTFKTNIAEAASGYEVRNAIADMPR